jgi:metal-responsive CopG/Arc/MetJ family transcriptional regulator
MRSKFCDEQMQFKLPQELVHAVEEVSRKRMISRSAYCRQALLEKLERDGVCPIMPTNTVAA